MPASAIRLPALLALAAFSPLASAEVLSFTFSMDGPSEATPNNSPGTGTGVVDIDTVLRTMRVRANWSGLVSNVTMAHIHASTPTPLTGVAGVATPVPNFPLFPTGVTAGSYDQTFNMALASSYNPAFITANGGTVDTAQAALFASFSSGRAYFNIHTTEFGSGEIRGFLVPAPGAALMLGAAGLLAARRRR